MSVEELFDIVKNLQPERAGHKYVRREGGPGNYKYFYTDSPAEAHGPGAVPGVEEQSYKREVVNQRTGMTSERSAVQVVPKSHSLEVSGATDDVQPEKAYAEAFKAALSQPGAEIPVKHSRMTADCVLTSNGDGTFVLRRTDKAPDSMLSANEEAAKSKKFSSYAAYEHWFLQTSNTQTINDPEGRPWFNIVPAIGKVNTKENKIDWSTDADRQYKLVYHPSFPKELQKEGREGRASSLAHAMKQLDDEYGIIEESLGRTPTKGKFAAEKKEDTAPQAAAPAETPAQEPEKDAAPLNFKKLPEMDEVMKHPSMKWAYDYATRDRKLQVSAQEKNALIQHAAKQFWPKLVAAADRLTNTPFFAGNKREVMADWIGQDLPSGSSSTPQHVFLLPESAGYKAIESALDLFDRKKDVDFTGFLAGKKGKINNAFMEAQRRATDAESKYSRGGGGDEDEGGGGDRLDRMTASEDQKEESEHLQTPEEQAEHKQRLDAKVVIPKLTQVLMHWEQNKPEKAPIIQQAKAAIRAIRTAPEAQRSDMLSTLMEKLSDAGMGKDLGLVKSLDVMWIVTLMEQQSVIRKAMDILTRDKYVDPSHSYSHMEGDDNNPRFFYRDQTGNVVRYTNAPTGDPDRADFYGDAKLHPSEPMFDKNPEYFTPDGRKLTRAPDADPEAVEWNSKYNRYDPKNLWIGRWRDPNSGEFRYTYVHSDVRDLPKLAIHQQNALTDARLGGMRSYYCDLFNKSDKIKDQMTAVALALLDQGKMRAIELAALTPDVLVIDGSLISLGPRKIYVDAKALAAFTVLKNTTPPGMPLFSIASQGRDKIDVNVRRMLGPHYLSRVMDLQGISLLGLQTYHGTSTFAKEIERLLTYYRASWDQAAQAALTTVALEWGHDFSMEPDPQRILQLVQEVLVDPVVVQVLQINAKAQGLTNNPGTATLPEPTVPVPYVCMDLSDLTADEKEFSEWTHSLSLHDFAEIPTDLALSLSKGLMLKEVEVHRKDGTTFQSKRWVKTESNKHSEESFYARGPSDHHLSHKPATVPSFKTAGDLHLGLDRVDVPQTSSLSYDNFSPYETGFSPGAKVAIEHMKGVMKDKFITASIQIAKKLQSNTIPLNDPEALKFVEINTKMNWAAGEYNRFAKAIQVTPSIAMDIYNGIKSKKVTSWEIDGFRVMVHEAMHHASNIHHYEGVLTSSDDQKKHRPHAALEEATTEILAQHCVRDICENLLGLPVVSEQKPIFQRLEDPFGNFEWGVRENGASYKPYVERFANLVAYADGLDDNSKMSNQEFQDHVAGRALEIKQKAQQGGLMAGGKPLPPIDQRWDAITNRVLDKYDLEAQLAHWGDDRRAGLSGSNWYHSSDEGGKAYTEEERKSRIEDIVSSKQKDWREDIKFGVQRAVQAFLTKSEPFHEIEELHIGHLDNFVKDVIESKGAQAWMAEWKPSVKRRMIGHKEIDPEGRAVRKKRVKADSAPASEESESQQA
jgi:hypothetical protein